jgi:hypothetical protein
MKKLFLAALLLLLVDCAPSAYMEANSLLLQKEMPPHPTLKVEASQLYYTIEDRNFKVLLINTLELYFGKKDGSLNQISKSDLLDRKIIINHKVPCKKGKAEDKFVINWMLHHKWQTDIWKKERKFSIIETIRRSFSGLKKDSSQWDVEYKIRNTLEFISQHSDTDLNYNNWPYAIELSDDT